MNMLNRMDEQASEDQQQSNSEGQQNDNDGEGNEERREANAGAQRPSKRPKVLAVAGTRNTAK